MMRGVLYHSLRGEPAWNCFCAVAGNAVDVSRVQEIYCRSRKFMVFQRHLPFELDILYELKGPSDRFKFIPSVNTRGQMGMALSTTYDFDEWVTLRYASEREALLDLQAVLAKQEQLRTIARRRFGGRPSEG